MGAQGLSSRAIIGAFFLRLQQALGTEWINDISMEFTSNQESETYKWLGMVPQMREWIGGRNAKAFRENGITITNKKYEATIEVLLDEIRRDKTGQVRVRIRELADRTNSHWAKLLTTLIENGETNLCYDGQAYFDTDHSEGSSGTQDNDLTNSIVLKTAPTAAEMEAAILDCITAILGFVDDQGEPINEGATAFRVMVPVPFMTAGTQALSNPIIQGTSGTRTNTLTQGGFSLSLDVNPRLTWTDKFAIFRADGNAKPLIRQSEKPVGIKAKAEGSEFEFDNDKHQYGVDANRNVGYGFWQMACLKTFTTT